ncbi:MAG TPA: VRR-NUC domain-containing protein [Trebonia sp.]|jgi:hypothetical protein
MTAPTPLEVQARAMSERELMDYIRANVAELHLAAFHAGDSRGSWGPGFPDLVIVGDHGILFIECKREREALQPLQVYWMMRLRRAGASPQVWRPTEWLDGTIRKELEAIV